MNLVDDFKYYTDKIGNVHSAGYLFNEQCIAKNGGQKGGGGLGLKDLAVPGGLFFGMEYNAPKHKVEKKDVIDESLFDKLFGCGCVEEKKGKKTTRKRKPNKNNRKTKRT
jgi:hypothetical protein